MGHYRKIDSRMWNDEKFLDLSYEAQNAFIYLLTHPSMTSLGAMRATIDGLGAERHRPPEAFRKAFEEVVEKGMVQYDDKVCFMCLPNFLNYNGPETTNVVIAWKKCFDLIPECELKVALLERAMKIVQEK